MIDEVLRLGIPAYGLLCVAQDPAAKTRKIKKVRAYVLERAQGRCEYCKEKGFMMPDGTRYLETHHIIALAKHGADQVDNVIALCPAHHREAHYGAEADALEDKFIEIVGKLKAPA